MWDDLIAAEAAERMEPERPPVSPAPAWTDDERVPPMDLGGMPGYGQPDLYQYRMLEAATTIATALRIWLPRLTWEVRHLREAAERLAGPAPSKNGDGPSE